MAADESAPELSGEELDALIAQAGLDLDPAERANVLATARFLRRSAELVRTFTASREGNEP